MGSTGGAPRPKHSWILRGSVLFVIDRARMRLGAAHDYRFFFRITRRHTLRP